MNTNARRNPDVLLPLEDFEHIPLLQSVSLNRDGMVALIRFGVLEGSYNGTTKRWETCIAFLKEAFLVRAEAFKRRGHSPDELDQMLRL
jgi:hypothetical protein